MTGLSLSVSFLPIAKVMEPRPSVVVDVPVLDLSSLEQAPSPTSKVTADAATTARWTALGIKDMHSPVVGECDRFGHRRSTCRCITARVAAYCGMNHGNCVPLLRNLYRSGRAALVRVPGRDSRHLHGPALRKSW